MISSVMVALFAASVVTLLVLLVVAVAARSRRREREQKWRQLESVYTNQERRIRGDR